MFKQSTVIILFMSTALLSACANNPTYFWYTSTEQLIENHQYQKAIEQITATVPINDTLLQKVHMLADQQRKTQIVEINRLIQQKKWGEANNTLSQLNINQPNLIEFTTLQSLIDKTQSEEQRLIDTRQALLEAALLEVKFIQQDLSDRIHNNKMNGFFSRSDLMAKKQALAEKLLHLSTQALFVKDYKNAQKAYEKALELDGNVGTGEITQAINEGLSQQNNKAIDERRNSLIKQLYFAISTQNFKSLFKIQEILSHEPFHGADVDKALNKAKKTRLEHSNKLNKSASLQYKNGNIALAVIQWRQALRLTPTNTRIREKLIRAQKVQRKLKKLTSGEKSQP